MKEKMPREIWTSKSHIDYYDLDKFSNYQGVTKYVLSSDNDKDMVIKSLNGRVEEMAKMLGMERTCYDVAYKEVIRLRGILNELECVSEFCPDNGKCHICRAKSKLNEKGVKNEKICSRVIVWWTNGRS